jgi:YihY family inner membrane protein
MVDTLNSKNDTNTSGEHGWGNKLAARAERIYGRANQNSGGILGIVRDAYERFSEVNGSESAASMAYYALFSMFPLLLFLVVALSFVLEGQEAYGLVVDTFSELFPGAEAVIVSNLESILAGRGTVGLIGLVGLLWSGTGVFTTLARNVNRAWPEAGTQSVVTQRVLALVMVGVLIALLILSMLSNTILDILRRAALRLGGDASVYDATAWVLVVRLAPFFTTFLLFLGLYRWVPRTQVQWADAFWGAIVAAPIWVIAGDLFSWYLSSGLAVYDLVYGSWGVVVAFLFWIYLGSWIIFFGAHLSAAVSRRSAQRQNSRTPATVRGKRT